MRYWKRLLGLLLALSMCGMLALPTFASSDVSDTSQTGSITIKNVEDNGEYKIYRFLIPTGRFDNNPEYTVDLVWAPFIKFEQGAAYYQSGDSYVRITESNAAESYEALMTYVGGKSIAPTKMATGNDSKAEFTNLEPGYYLLDCGNGVGGFFPLGAGEYKEMFNKRNTGPYLEKKILVEDKDGNVNRVDYTTVNVGDTVRFEVTATLPTQKDWVDWTNNSNGSEWYYNFHLYDEVSESGGLRLNPDVSVTVDGVEYVESGKTQGGTGINGDVIRVQYNGDTDIKNFAIRFGAEDSGGRTGGSLEFLESANHWGAVVVVSYTATVLQRAAQTPKEYNKMTLFYDERKIENTVYVYDFTIVAGKVSAEDGTGLPGAQFVLQRESDNKFYSAEKKSDSSYHVGDRVTWVDAEIDYDAGTLIPKNGDELLPWTIMTAEEYNEKAMIHFEGISVGTYLLHEIKAPEDYSRITNPVKIVIREKENGNVDPSNVTFEFSVNGGEFQDMGINRVLWEEGWQQLTMDPDNPPIKVENSKGGFELPETGGSGTMLVYAFGGVLLLCAAVLLIGRKQKNA